MMFSHRTVLLLVLSSLLISNTANAFISSVGHPSCLLPSSNFGDHPPISASSLSAATTVDSPAAGVSEEPSQEEDNEPESTSAVLQSPGLREDDMFDCDSSVQYWKEFQSEGNNGNLERLVQTLRDNANTDNLSRAYWTSHLVRTGYFTMNAALGSVVSDLHERFVASRGGDNNVPQKEEEENKENDKEGSKISPLFSNDNDMTNRLVNSDVPSRLLLEAIRVYEQDYQYVKQGLLKFPWDALVQDKNNNRIQWNSNHKQANPLFVLQETANTVFESVAIFSRRNQQLSKGVLFSSPKSPNSNNAKMYPDYYLNDFHYQTDGWLSSSSAQKYEAATETLFLGRQDAMQRQTLIPIILLREDKTAPTSILDVAAGTGRFGTFVRDQFPTAQMTYTDLSPFYLEKARENDQYWISQRGQEAMNEQQTTGEKKKVLPEPATIVQANAEDLPFEDNSFDVVTCVYLFHELPAQAQRRAAQEMVRVTKPGGMIVFSDSIQKGDRPPLDAYMGNFGRLNEPHYDNYIETYLPDLFEGCEPGKKLVASSTKTLSFIKK